MNLPINVETHATRSNEFWINLKKKTHRFHFISNKKKWSLICFEHTPHSVFCRLHFGVNNLFLSHISYMYTYLCSSTPTIFEIYIEGYIIKCTFYAIFITYNNDVHNICFIRALHLCSSKETKSRSINISYCKFFIKSHYILQRKLSIHHSGIKF